MSQRHYQTHYLYTALVKCNETWIAVIFHRLNWELFFQFKIRKPAWFLFWNLVTLFTSRNSSTNQLKSVKFYLVIWLVKCNLYFIPAIIEVSKYFTNSSILKLAIFMGNLEEYLLFFRWKSSAKLIVFAQSKYFYDVQLVSLLDALH